MVKPLSDQELLQLQDKLNKCPSCNKWFDTQDFAPLEEFQCDDCGALAMAPYRIATYWLYRQIGEGGMGRVYMAQEMGCPHLYAIKMAKYTNECDFAFQSLLYEGEIILNIQHECLPTAHDFGYKKGEAFLIMDFEQGETLEHFVQYSEIYPIPEKMLLNWAMQLVDTLRTLYNYGYIYRDLKPQNILVNESKVILVDFGLAMHKEYVYDIDEENLVGSPAYIPPERINGTPEDFRSDIYSLGMVIYYAARGGEDYYPGDDHELIVKYHLEPHRDAIAPLLPNYSPEFSQVLDQMIKFDPATRYQSYDDLYHDLNYLHSRLK